MKSVFLPKDVDEVGRQERTEKWNRQVFGCIDIVETAKDNTFSPQ